MKKTMILLVSVGIVFGLSGCSGLGVEGMRGVNAIQGTSSKTKMNMMAECKKYVTIRFHLSEADVHVSNANGSNGRYIVPVHLIDLNPKSNRPALDEYGKCIFVDSKLKEYRGH